MYNCILIDIDSLTKELKHIEKTKRNEVSLYEDIIVKGIRSLKNFEVIFFSTSPRKYPEKWLRKNRISKPELFVLEETKAKTQIDLIKKILSSKGISPKRTVIVSSDLKILKQLSLVSFHTCLLETFQKCEESVNTTHRILKLESLHSLEEKQTSAIESKPTQPSFIQNLYIDSFSFQKLSLENRKIIEEDVEVYKGGIEQFEFLYSLGENSICITSSPEQQCVLEAFGIPSCYLVTSNNDQVERHPTYEISIKNIDKIKKLKKM